MNDFCDGLFFPDIGTGPTTPARSTSFFLASLSMLMELVDWTWPCPALTTTLNLFLGSGTSQLRA